MLMYINMHQKYMVQWSNRIPHIIQIAEKAADLMNRKKVKWLTWHTTVHIRNKKKNTADAVEL